MKKAGPAAPPREERIGNAAAQNVTVALRR